MFGASRGVTLGFAGWLWADLLLGLFAIFALASTVGAPRALPGAGASAVPSGAFATPAATGIGAASGLDGGTAARGNATVRGPGVDPAPLELTLAVNGSALLGGEARAILAEQQRIATEAARRVGSRRVAFVMAYGSNADARNGDRLAELATAQLRGGAFEGAAVRAFHNLVAGDRGTTLQLSVYFFQE